MVNLKKISCDLCGSDIYTSLFKAKDRLHGFEGSFTYVKCDSCSMVYMNPQISSDDIAAFYPDDYAPHKGNPLQKKNKVRAIIKNYPFLESLWKKLNEQSKLLDVGCGNGSFLDTIKKLTHCNALGIDLSETAVKAAKNNYGLDVFKGTIEEAPFPKESLDMITAWSFIEHVNNPSEVFAQFHELLMPAGNIVIKTPNFDSLNAKLFKDKWYNLDCPRHLFIFSPKTINKYLKKNGFILENIWHEKSSKGIRASLQYYYCDNNYDPKKKNIIRNSKLVKSIASPLSILAAWLSKADTIIIHAKKI